MFETPTARHKHDRNPWINNTHTQQTHSSPRFLTFHQNLLRRALQNSLNKNMAYTYIYISFPSIQWYRHKNTLPLGFPRAPCWCGLLVFRWARRYMSYRPARSTDVSTNQRVQHVHYMEQHNTLNKQCVEWTWYVYIIMIYDTVTVKMYTDTTKNDCKKTYYIVNFGYHHLQLVK